jgi:hypothetical protein
MCLEPPTLALSWLGFLGDVSQVIELLAPKVSMENQQLFFSLSFL